MKIGIVAHHKRYDDAFKLYQTVNADYLSVDDGKLGPRENHLRVWEHIMLMADENEWCCVLEDDVIPVPWFRDQLNTVIESCPREIDIISLYMGRRHPKHQQDRMKQAVALADSKHACWITSSLCIHGVGIAMMKDEVGGLIHHARTIQGNPRPIDETISAWSRLTKRTVGYCYPSIVNHTDGETLIHHPDGIKRQKGRVAWNFGGRGRWSGVTIPLDPNNP